MESLFISPLEFLEKYWDRELNDNEVSLYLKGLTKKQLGELFELSEKEGERVIVEFANSIPTPNADAIHEGLLWKNKLGLKILDAERELDSLPLTAFQIRDKKNRGRQTRPFKESMNNDAGNKKLSALHFVMQNKKGKGAALVMICAKKLGWIEDVTSTQVRNEFGDIGQISGFNRYYNNPGCYDNEEIEGMIIALTEALNRR